MNSKELKNLNNDLIQDCLKSINIFIDFLNEMIYENGGIPQYYPLQGYHFINLCFNDGAVINYLRCINFILNSEIKKEVKISLCSLESAQVVIYLISLPNPNNRIKNAIISACEWFYLNKIIDYEQIINNNEVNINYNLNNKRNLYSRYYSLENNSPIFFDRSGNEYNLNSFNTLDSGLRNGYTWLGCWGDYLYEIYSFWKLIY